MVRDGSNESGERFQVRPFRGRLVRRPWGPLNPPMIGIDGHEEEGQGEIIPGGPASILGLERPGHRSLRGVLASVEGIAGLAVASWIGEGKIRKGRIWSHHVHLEWVVRVEVSG